MTETVAYASAADVFVADDMDRLFVVPRRGTDAMGVARALRQALPGLAHRRTAHGFPVPPRYAGALLAADIGVPLRWSPDARRFAENRSLAWTAHPHLREAVIRIKEGGRRKAEQELNPLEGLDVLDDHQVVNVAAMTLPNSPGLCVFDEQGAGKTVTMIFAFDVLVARDWADTAIIVAPKSMVSEWARDIARFKGDLYRVTVVTGDRSAKRRALREQSDIFLVNFETAVTHETEIAALLRRHDGRSVLIVDESFFVKNLDAKRTRALRRLREFCRRAYVLCGTPAPNAPHDLVQQFNFVDFGLTFDEVPLPADRDIARPLAQAAISERGLYVRHLKREVLPELPQRTYHTVLVPLEPEQERAYRAALNDLVLDLRATDDRGFDRRIASFLARRSILLQICSHPAAVVQGYAEIPAKLLALDEILRDLIDRRREKVLLWSYYTVSLDAVSERYKHYRPVRYDGTVVDMDVRRQAIRQFQEDDRTMLFLGNPAAAGAGLTLHRARYAVYESMSNQAAHYLQSLDRIHRRGQTRAVEYLILLCDRTIEVPEYKRLIRKELAAHQLLGDPHESRLTRETMLREMLAAWTALDHASATTLTL